MTGVAIVGAGIHPFGRHDGVSGLTMGVQALISLVILGLVVARAVNILT